MWDSFVVKEEMWGKKTDERRNDGLHLNGKGLPFCQLSGVVASVLGKVRYLNWLGRGGCQRRLKTYKSIADAREYRGNIRICN